MTKSIQYSANECGVVRKEICKRLLSSSRVLVCSHLNPDGDAVGSSSGIALTLKALGKEVVVYNETGVHPKYHFIPGADSVVSVFPESSFDTVVVCDCADLKRLGDESAQLIAPHSFLINIDHHISNTSFGSLNLVVPDATSTCEVLVPLVEELIAPQEMTHEIATSLLTGIVSDTGSFRYRSTTSEALEMAASLIRHGAALSNITIGLFSELSFATVRLQSLALSRVSLSFDNRIALIVVTEELYREAHAEPDDTEGLAEQARDIAGVEVGALIRWHGDRWRVSLRGKPDYLDLSAVASQFGGGGHKAAAAFRFSGDLEYLTQQLLNALAGALAS
jgi:bifunctional oligoribonuclease and PAP phosphatase NrnA